MFQQAFNLCARGKQAPGNGGFGATEGTSVFSVGETVVSAQQDGSALFGWEFHQGFLDLLGSPRVIVGHLGFLPSPFLVGLVLTLPAFVPVEAAVDRNAIEPGGCF